MPGHAIGQIKPKRTALAHHVADCSPGAAHGQQEVSGSLEELQALSRRGLWGILLFLTLSAVTLYLSESGLLSLMPADLRELFGDPPPIQLVHIALGVSWLSALVLVLGRLTGDATPGYNWYNVGLPTAFFPLYVFSDSAGKQFPAVFAAGLILLIVEHLSVVCYASRALRAEKERISRLPN